MVRCDIFGGIRAAIEILENALPQISTEKLVDYALQYKVGASIKRLGWLLEQMGESSHVIEPLRDYPVTSYYRLDPRGAPGGESYPRWRIVENIKVKRNARPYPNIKIARKTNRHEAGYHRERLCPELFVTVLKIPNQQRKEWVVAEKPNTPTAQAA